MIRSYHRHVLPIETEQDLMPADQPSDTDLILAIGRGDVTALEEFYDRHRVVAYSLALRILGAPGDAEDAIQEVFLSVWRSAGSYHPDRSSGRSWFLSMVHHRCIDKLRARQSRPRSVALEDDPPYAARTDVWGEVLANLTHETVAGAVSALPADQREAIELAYFGGYTHTEIAERTGAPLGTVKGRIRLGLHRLKDLLVAGEEEMVTD